MNKPFIIGSSVVSVLLLLFAIYFFAFRGSGGDLAREREGLQGALATAEDKLDKSKSTLDSMVGSLSDSFSLALSVQDQMKRSFSLVKQTDFLFTDANGKNPQLIFGSPLSSIDINAQRIEVNALLAEWQKQTNILSLSKINLAESKKIKQQAEIIKQYIENILKIAGSLTVENSGLSQYQIDTYISRLPSLTSIDGVIAAINTATVVSETSISSPTTGTNTEVGAGATGAQGSTSSSSSAPQFTPEEVVAQQAVVAAAQVEVETILEQIRQIDQQIEEAANPAPSPVPTPSLTPTPSPIEVTPTPEPVVEAPASNTETNNSIFIPPRERILYQGIIIQPGDPRLIQGTDPY